MLRILEDRLSDVTKAPIGATVNWLECSGFQLSKSSNDKEILRLAIIEADDEIEDGKEAQSALKTKIVAAQLRLDQLKRKRQGAWGAYQVKMYDILFNEIPAYGHHRALPPISHDVVEKSNQIGPYELLDCIAKGGFAKVFRARHKARGSYHAIKRLEKRKFNSFKDLAQLAREIQVLQSHIHENVTTCSDVINATMHIYIVMGLSFCDLHTYFSRWRSSMGESVIREVSCGTLQGLECLHHIGIAHLDLKPENILVSKNAQPWMLTSENFQICDLGLCEISTEPNDEILVDCMRGTAGFVSPEMVLLQDGCTVEGRCCDMWSVGVILLELLEGISSTWFRIYHDQRENPDDRTFASKLSDQLSIICNCSFARNSGHDLIRQMLVWDPRQRISAKASLEHPWLARKHSMLHNQES